jgi:hypothetical protein
LFESHPPHLETSGRGRRCRACWQVNEGLDYLERYALIALQQIRGTIAP